MNIQVSMYLSDEFIEIFKDRIKQFKDRITDKRLEFYFI